MRNLLPLPRSAETLRVMLLTDDRVPIVAAAGHKNISGFAQLSKHDKRTLEINRKTAPGLRSVIQKAF